MAQSRIYNPELTEESFVNVGTGSQLLKDVGAGNFQFRTIVGLGGVAVVQTSTEVIISFTDTSTLPNVACVPSLNVGDLAVFFGTVLIKPTSNADSEIPYGVAGIVVSKPSPTLCNIIINGDYAGVSGLVAGAPCFISATGDITNICPPTGNVQFLGFAISPTRIAFSPKQVMRRQ